MSDPDHFIELAMREIPRSSTEPVEPQNPIEAEEPRPQKLASLLPDTATQGEMIVMLTWAEVGLVTHPGRYNSRHGLVEVTADDLWVWTRYPNAAFVLMPPSPYAEEKVFRLGTFELRKDWNVPRNERGDL